MTQQFAPQDFDARASASIRLSSEDGGIGPDTANGDAMAIQPKRAVSIAPGLRALAPPVPREYPQFHLRHA